MRVRRNSNAFKTALRSDRGSVLHEVTANSLPHPVRINEQVLEIKDAINKDSGGETHDVITVDGDSGQPFGDAVPLQHQRLRVGEESITVTFIGKRRPDEHIRQRRQVSRSAPTDTKQRHRPIVTCSTHPSLPDRRKPGMGGCPHPPMYHFRIGIDDRSPIACGRDPEPRNSRPCRAVASRPWVINVTGLQSTDVQISAWTSDKCRASEDPASEPTTNRVARVD